ncbi:MAG: leucyl/phenylalanyl-tRNA--protein transferase [Thalassovita sp.]
MTEDELEMTPQLLMAGYASGVFPMAESRDDTEIFWVDPRMRGVFPLDQFHISRSLVKRLRREDYTIRVNTDFEGVVMGCADREETWINAQIYDLYGQLHALGHAHSLEVWMDDVLVGGVYGVTLGHAFFGESMFSRRTDASKIALAYLVDRLRQTGFTLFDTQFITPHLASLGAIEITRANYRGQLRQALEGDDAVFDALPLPQSASEMLQRRTQTS